MSKASLTVYKADNGWIVSGIMRLGLSKEKINIRYKTKQEAEEKARAIISAYLYIR